VLNPYTVFQFCGVLKNVPVLKRFTTRWGTWRLDALTSKVIEDYMAERMATVTLATCQKNSAF
jgi:hypothetical protein